MVSIFKPVQLQLFCFTPYTDSHTISLTDSVPLLPLLGEYVSSVEGVSINITAICDEFDGGVVETRLRNFIRYVEQIVNLFSHSIARKAAAPVAKKAAPAKKAVKAVKKAAPKKVVAKKVAPKKVVKKVVAKKAVKKVVKKAAKK